MKRSFSLLFAAVASAGLLACSSDDAAEPQCEVEGGEACFVRPSAVMVIEGDATPNWNCAAPTIQVTTAPLTISGTIGDFQTPSTKYEGASIASYIDLNFGAAGTATATSGAGGEYQLDIPAGGASNFMHFVMKHPQPPICLDTIAVYVPVDTSMPATVRNRDLISQSTATGIPALLGIVRTAGSGVLAGEVNDCDGKVVKNAIATVSSTSSKDGSPPTHVAPMQMYYFTSGLPVRRTAQKATNTDGLFVGIQVPAAAGNYYLQAWGYKTAADVQSGNLTLVAEQEIPAFADTVVSTTMFPTEGP